jgi:nucleoside-diphosphate-sugar epimerase
VVALDVAELAACQEACKTIDVVIHLAADAGPGADFYGSLLDDNIKRTCNVLRAQLMVWIDARYRRRGPARTR